MSESVIMSDSRHTTRKKVSNLWNYFMKNDPFNKLAKCKMCKSSFSYKTTITNLKEHLKKKHTPAFKTFVCASSQIPNLVDKNVRRRNSSSRLWSYFVKDDSSKKIARCKLCEKGLSYKTTITNLKQHLKRFHITAYHALRQSSSMVDDAIEIDVKQVELVDLQLGLTASTICKIEKPSSSIQSSPSSIALTEPTFKRQNLKTSYIPRTLDQEGKDGMDKSLLGLFIWDLQPFSIIEGKGFVEFVNNLNPSYGIPSRNEITSVMIPELFQTCRDDMKTLLFTQAKTVCLTADCWTSRFSESYAALTAHFVTDDLDFKSVFLDCVYLSESHQGVDLSNKIGSILADWGLTDKITTAISNNVNNVKDALSLLGFDFYSCYARTLDFIVQDALKIFDTTLGKIKEICAHIGRKHSAPESYQFETQNSQELSQSVAMGWESTFLMIKRYTEEEEDFSSTVDLEVEELPVITAEERSACEQLRQVLLPFDEATKQMSREKYMSGGSVIVITLGLIASCEELRKEDFGETATQVLDRLRKGLIEGLPSIESNQSIALCTFLDPRYKVYGFDDDMAIRHIKTTVEHLVVDIIERKKTKSDPLQTLTIPETEQKISIWNQFEKKSERMKPTIDTSLKRAIHEVELFLNEELLPRNGCPLEWWKENRYTFPNLVELFIEKCNVVATAMPCDMLFSEAGYLIRERRANLSAGSMKPVLFLNTNLNV